MSSSDPCGTPIVDMHAHWLPPSMLDACRIHGDWQGMQMGRAKDGRAQSTINGKAQTYGPPLHLDGLTSRADVLDRCEIDQQLISLLPPLYRYDSDTTVAIARCRQINDELAEDIAGAPAGRYRGLAVLPMQDLDASLNEMRRAVEELSLDGAALGTHVRGVTWDDRRFWEILRLAESLDVLVFIHPNGRDGGAQHTLVEGYFLGNIFGQLVDTTSVIEALVFGGAFEEFPNLKLLAAHGGGYTAMAAGRMEHGWRVRTESKQDLQRSPRESMRHLFVDSVVHSEKAIRFLVDELGANNVVLGTDFPAEMGVDHPVESVRAAFADDDGTANAVLSGNAMRMFRS